MRETRRRFLAALGAASLGSLSGCQRFLSSNNPEYGFNAGSDEKADLESLGSYEEGGYDERTSDIGRIRARITADNNLMELYEAERPILKNPNSWAGPDRPQGSGSPDPLTRRLVYENELGIRIFYTDGFDVLQHGDDELEEFLANLVPEIDFRVEQEGAPEQLENVVFQPIHQQMEAVYSFTERDELGVLMSRQGTIQQKDNISGVGYSAENAVITQKKGTISDRHTAHEIIHAGFGVGHPYYPEGIMSANQQSENLCDYTRVCIDRVLSADIEGGRINYPPVAKERAVEAFANNLHYYLRDRIKMDMDGMVARRYLGNGNEDKIVYEDTQREEYLSFAVTSQIEDVGSSEKPPEDIRGQKPETTVELSPAFNGVQVVD